LQLTKNNFFWIKNYNLPYPYASIKDAQVTKEAFSSQRRTSSTSKHDISKYFLLSRVIFALLDPEPDPDPDPKNCITE
jgi:hypothetical protein